MDLHLTRSRSKVRIIRRQRSTKQYERDSLRHPEHQNRPSYFSTPLLSKEGEERGQHQGGVAGRSEPSHLWGTEFNPRQVANRIILSCIPQSLCHPNHRDSGKLEPGLENPGIFRKSGGIVRGKKHV